MRVNIEEGVRALGSTGSGKRGWDGKIVKKRKERKAEFHSCDY